MNQGKHVFWMFVVAVWATFTIGMVSGADALNGEKKQAIREAKQDVTAIKQEKIASLHALRDDLKKQQTDLKRLYKEGKLTRAQYKAQLKEFRRTMQHALQSARAKFQAALGLTKSYIKDLKADLVRVSNRDEIIEAVEEYNKEINSVVNDLNSDLKEIAKDANIDFNDIIVSIS